MGRATHVACCLSNGCQFMREGGKREMEREATSHMRLCPGHEVTVQPKG